MSVQPAPTQPEVAAEPTTLRVVYDIDTFDGLDLNQGTVWLDVDGVTHDVAALLVTERLSAVGELEAMASVLVGGDELLRRSRLYAALLQLAPSPADGTEPDHHPGEPAAHSRSARPAHLPA